MDCKSNILKKKLIKENSISPINIEIENGKGRFPNIEKIRATYAALKCEIVWTEYICSKKGKELFLSFSSFDWNSSKKSYQLQMK